MSVKQKPNEKSVFGKYWEERKKIDTITRITIVHRWFWQFAKKKTIFICFSYTLIANQIISILYCCSASPVNKMLSPFMCRQTNFFPNERQSKWKLLRAAIIADFRNYFLFEMNCSIFLGINCDKSIINNCRNLWKFKKKKDDLWIGVYIFIFVSSL